jgi:hypothetical protein
MKKKTTSKNQQKINTNTKIKSQNKSGYTPPSDANLNVVPYIIGLVAAFFLFCMLFPQYSGFIGESVKTVFGGLFSYAAYLIPFLLLARSLNYKKEAVSRYPGINWWLSFFFLCAVSSILACIKCESSQICSNCLMSQLSYSIADMSTIFPQKSNFV